jgi:hypothetical protein
VEITLHILFWIGIALSSILGLLLFVPLHLRAEGSLQGLSGSGRVRARWGWFVLIFDLDSGAGARLRLFGLTLSRFKGRASEQKKKRKKEKKKENKKPAGGFGHFWRNRRILLRLALRILSTLHPRGRLRGVVGFDDPADTAWLDLALWQLRGRWQSFEVDVSCDFTDEVLELDGDFRAWIWPVQVVLVGLLLMLSKRNRRALRARS